MDFSLSIEASDSGTATPNFSDADLLSKSPLLGKQHLHLQTSLSNSTSSETLNSSGGNTHSVSSPISHSDDLMMLGGGDRSNPSSGTSTPPLAIPGQHQHLAQTPFLSVSATLSASTSIQSLASVSSSVSCSASKRKAVPRRSLSLSESISDPDIVKLDVFDLFRRQPKRLLEEVEIIVESPPSSASSSSSEPPHVNPVRRVNSLPHMTSTEQQRWGSARGGEWSGDDASSVGSTQATLLSSSAPNKKRFYQKRTASPDDEDNDAEAGYHTRLPPMIDTTGYRESNAEIHSPALPSAASPHFSSDSLNPLSPTTNYRDYSDADEEAIAAARELGSLKIFGNIYGYDEPSSQGSNSGSKKNRRGSSASRRQPTNNRLPIRASSNDPDNLLSQSQEWGEDDMMDSENPNGASRAVNRSHYPPVSGRGSEGAFQTTQHMPKGQIRSVLVNNRFKDTAGKDVAHWKCTPLRIDQSADRYEELTAEEIETCENLRLLPVQYMHIKDIILSQAYNRTFFRKGDARTWFKMDVTKFGRLYDWFDEELGWFPWSPSPSPSAIESMKEFGLNPKNYSRSALLPPNNNSHSSSRSNVGGMVGAVGHH